MNLKTTNIVAAVQGKVIGKFPKEFDFRVVTDTRANYFPSNAFFVALKGPNFNGKSYTKDALQKGCFHFLVSEESHVPEGANGIVVEDTLKALQLIAKMYRDQFDIPVVAITGSNGKTIVKDWLFELCTSSYKVYKSPKSYNSQLGVALSLLGIEPYHDIAIIEAGISKDGEMEGLATMISPTLGIFTNNGAAHLDGFVSNRKKLEEKNRLFKTSKKIFVQDEDAYAILKKAGNEKYALVDRTAVEEYFKTDIDVKNAATAFAMAKHLGVSHKDLGIKLPNLRPLNMRLQLLKGRNNCDVINDGYSLDLDSLEIALKFQERHKNEKLSSVILSDFAHKGSVSDYTRLGQLLKQYRIEKAIFIGFDIEDTSGFKECYSFDSIEAFKKGGILFEREIVLIKGARKFRMETLLPHLIQKTHQTYVEFNLKALSNNIDFFRSKLESKTKIMAMVKAASYGGGTHEIANLLAFKKIDYLCVAYIDEGVVLRDAGLSMPIMVLNSEEQGLATCIEYDLEPVVFSLAYLKKVKSRIGTKRVNIHLELDTGMKRLGMEEKELNECLKFIENNDAIKLKSVFTHLATADNKKLDVYTTAQIAKFEAWTKNLNVLKHICNTAGILRFPEAHMDMVRLGIGMYGVSPIKKNVPLENVLSLKTVISQIKEIKRGDAVGYSRVFIAKEGMKIAILPIGYADGMRRAWSNGNAVVSINGETAQTIGNICMDMCMVNVSNVECEEGDEVVIFESEEQINALARSMNSIAYEVLTGISDRVNRVFVEE